MDLGLLTIWWVFALIQKMSLWQSYITNWWLFICVLCPIVVVPCVQAQPGLWVPPYLRELPQTPKPVAFVTSRRKSRWSRSRCLPAIFPLWWQSWKWSRKKEAGAGLVAPSHRLLYTLTVPWQVSCFYIQEKRRFAISHHPIENLSSTFWQHFFFSNVEVVEYIHKEHLCLTWRVLVHYPPIRGIVCDVTSMHNEHCKNYKRCIVQKMHKGCTLHMLSSGNTRKK